MGSCKIRQLNSSTEVVSKIKIGKIEAPGKDTLTTLDFGFVPDVIYTASTWSGSTSTIVEIYNKNWNTGKSIHCNLGNDTSVRSFPVTATLNAGHAGIYPPIGSNTIGTSAIFKCRDIQTMNDGITYWIAVQY